MILFCELWWTIAIYLDRETINSLTETSTKLSRVFDEKFWYMRAGGARVLPQVHIIATHVSWQRVCYPDLVHAWYYGKHYNQTLVECDEIIAIDDINYYRFGMTSPDDVLIKEVINNTIYYLHEDNSIRDHWNVIVRSGVLHCVFSKSKVLVLDLNHRLWMYDRESFIYSGPPEELIEFPFGKVVRVGMIRDEDLGDSYSYWFLTDDNSCYCYLSKNSKGQYNYSVLRDVDSLTVLDEDCILVHISGEYKIMYTENKFLRVKEETFEPHFFLKGRPFIIVDYEVFSWGDYCKHFNWDKRKEHSFVRFS